ncbi:alpha/beta fold hydrolase [Solicola sp. PLA-1-18]|uniref:alpha/beta fold hydrolase n=1 Tax=Solicola sp. PLA-1-18 TaxID=3380532 RepID=UPI003B7DA123
MLFHRPEGRSGSLAYLDLPGPGSDVVVYLGGLGSASTVAFAPVVHRRRQAGRSLVVDLLCSGWSDHDAADMTIQAHADAVASVVAASVEVPVSLVGHSLGGSVAIALAHRHPGLVSRLTVCEPNLDPGVGTFSSWVSSWSEEGFAAHGHREVVEQLTRDAGAGDENAAEFARTVARWSPRGLHRTAASLLADRTPTFREQLASLDLPRLLVSGDRDWEPQPDLVDAGCATAIVPDAGHVMMADNLDGFCATLDRA